MAGFFRTRQPFLQTNAWQNQSLNALHYNTSQQGSVIPLIYGTTRQSVNLVDFGDYRGPKGAKGKTGSLPVSGTQSRSAKGGSSKSGKKANPNYSVDVMFAVCQGPINGIGNVFSSAGVADFGGLPLNFYSGADGQAADPTFVSLGHAVGYSGTAMVSGTPLDLGPSPVIPNIAVEAIAILVGTNAGGYTSDANPANIITDFLTNARYGSGFPSANLFDLTTLTGTSFAEYCQAVPFLISVSLDGHQKAIEWLDSIARLCNTAMFFSGKLLKFIPYGDLTLNNNGAMWAPNLTPAYALTDDSFLPWRQHEPGQEPQPGEEDPVLVTRTNTADADNWLSIEYTDRGNFYNSTTLTVNDQGLTDTYGLRIGDSIQGRAFCNQQSAQIAAQLVLQRKAYIRNSPYKFQTGWQFALLEPMDIVTLTGRYADLYLNAQPVRILSIEEDDQGGLTIEAEDIQTGTSAPVSVPVPIMLEDQAANGQVGPFFITASSITTTKPTIILVYLAGLQSPAVPHSSPLEDIPYAASVVGSTLGSFTNRWRYTNDPFTAPFTQCGLAGPPCRPAVELWWKAAPGNLTGETITVTYAPSGIVAGIVSVVAYSGVNMVDPFDTNMSLPKFAQNLTNAATLIEVPGCSTNQAGMALAFSSCWSTLINLSTHGVPPWELLGAMTPGQQAIQVFAGVILTSNVCQLPTVGATSGFTSHSFDFAVDQWISAVDALRST